jgi:hypothetical protein
MTEPQAEKRFDKLLKAMLEGEAPKRKGRNENEARPDATPQPPQQRR